VDPKEKRKLSYADDYDFLEKSGISLYASKRPTTTDYESSLEATTHYSSSPTSSSGSSLTRARPDLRAVTKSQLVKLRTDTKRLTILGCCLLVASGSDLFLSFGQFRLPFAFRNDSYRGVTNCCDPIRGRKKNLPL